MKEDERAEWLARAIENLISGEPPAAPPPGLARAELDALTRVARARLEAGRTTARDAAQYERQVWQEVLSRLERLHNQDKLATNMTSDDVVGVSMTASLRLLSMYTHVPSSCKESVSTVVTGGVAYSCRRATIGSSRAARRAG